MTLSHPLTAPLATVAITHSLVVVSPETVILNLTIMTVMIQFKYF